MGLLTLGRGSSLRSNSIRNSHSFGGSQRSQSSFSFLNNPSLLQKEQVKQSRRKNRKTVAKVDEEAERPQLHKAATEVKADQKQKRHDYSWLPRVPSTTNLKPHDMSMKVLYSGYRPLFIDPEEVKASTESSKSGGTLYEFAMRLEELGGQSSWVTSATGLEYYREWEGVPGDLQKKLKPFVAPENEKFGGTTDEQALKKLKEQIYLKERDKRLNRSKGRKRPIVSLLQLRKKLKQDDWADQGN